MHSVCLYTVLRFSFEEPSYEVSESVQETHYLLVMIENFDSVTIPESVTITISAVVNTATSNATQGMYGFSLVLEKNVLNFFLLQALVVTHYCITQDQTILLEYKT